MMKMRMTLAPLVTLALWLVGETAASAPRGSQGVSRTAIVKQLLDPENYDNKIPPHFNDDDPINVTIGIYINSFDTISAQSMDYSMSIFLRMSWSDERLAYGDLLNDTYLSLDPRILGHVWVPDLYFPNEKRAHLHDVMVPNRFMRISQKGHISYSTRVSLKLSCPMSLYKFPLDTQTCSMDIESYAYNAEKIKFGWTKKGPRPVEIPELELPQFVLIDHRVDSFVRSYSTGDYSALRVTFVLERDVGFYMIHTYVPSVLIVILSWVSFWISSEAIPARISLGVTTVLTMTTQSSGITSSLPKVSYVKAIDVWMFTCLLFVFGALLEFAFVNVLTRRDGKRHFRQLHKERTEQATGGHAPDSGGKETEGKLQAMLTKDNKVKTVFTPPMMRFGAMQSPNAVRVDVISRYTFPLAFIVFNIFYWVLYRSLSDPNLDDVARK